MCCAPVGDNSKIAWILFHQYLAAVHNVDAAAADAAEATAGRVVDRGGRVGVAAF